VLPNPVKKKPLDVKWHSDGHGEKIRERQRENKEVCWIIAKVFAEDNGVTHQEVSNDGHHYD